MHIHGRMVYPRNRIMCRFLLVKSENSVDPRLYLEKFSAMAEKSKAFDGDWQGDGWGISWLNKQNRWVLHKSLKPIWQDKSSFFTVSRSRILLIHARSASFPQHKNNIDFNQPYIDNRYSYVFNGYLMGVRLTLKGKIGAEKIWLLLRKLLTEKNPTGALKKAKRILHTHTRQIQALNIGISDGKSIFALNYFTKHPFYYQLHFHKDQALSLICSEPLDGIDFTPVPSGTILSF